MGGREFAGAMLQDVRQIKAARSLLGWEQHLLAKRSGVAISTIRRLERLNGPMGAHFETISKLQRALKSAGVVLLTEPSIGVCLKVFDRGISR